MVIIRSRRGKKSPRTPLHLQLGCQSDKFLTGADKTIMEQGLCLDWKEASGEKAAGKILPE
jgi:hypothetical protein